MQNYQFTLSFEVRDSECDIQGIVNNAVYLNYLEHARHRFLKEKGLDFSQLAQEGVNLIVVRSEVDYKFPLRSGDFFIVAVNVERISDVRFGFLQDIYRTSDDKLIVKSKFICAAMDQSGKPIFPRAVESLFPST